MTRSILKMGNSFTVGMERISLCGLSSKICFVKNTDGSERDFPFSCKEDSMTWLLTFFFNIHISKHICINHFCSYSDSRAHLLLYSIYYQPIYMLLLLFFVLCLRRWHLSKIVVYTFSYFFSLISSLSVPINIFPIIAPSWIFSHRAVYQYSFKAMLWSVELYVNRFLYGSTRRQLRLQKVIEKRKFNVSKRWCAV